MSERAQRQLAAILAADVAGYSRLIGLDEEGTLARLKALRRTVIDPKITEYRGHIVKTMGDGLLVQFASAVDAVRCAVDIQGKMSEQNEGADAAHRLDLRVGINVGDVVIDGGDIYGEGVNIAARIESIAPPGAVAVSGVVRDHIGSRRELQFDDLGEKTLKNIDRPVHVYLVRDGSGSKKYSPAVPEKPSIAVLPFQNMSGDPEQEYFADGIVEEIITALSRFQQLFVIARNSSFAYKGKAVDVKQIGRELGVRYVLEGSVRQAANRVRITGQLIDTGTGAHLWADRFDGPLEDVFELQDLITSDVVGAIAPKVEQAEIDRSRRKPTGSLDAYDHYLRGLSATHQWTKEAVAEALIHFKCATDVDPKFAAAYGWAARCYSQLKALGEEIDAGDIQAAERLALKAAELGWNDAVALAGAGIALAYVVGDLDNATAFTDRAIALNPNLVWAWHFSGWTKLWKGEPEEAIACFKRAMRMSPKDAQLFDMHDAISAAYFVIGEYQMALTHAKSAVREKPFTLAFCIAAASAALLERMEEARKIVETLKRYEPTLTIGNLRGIYLEFRRPEDYDRFASGLRKAGLPE